MRQGDDVGYSMDEWPTCASGQAINESWHRQQTGAFNRFSQKRLAHRVMCRAGTLPILPLLTSLFGVSFGREIPLSEGSNNSERFEAPRERLFSMLIPTHNRLDLIAGCHKDDNAKRWWETSF